MTDTELELTKLGWQVAILEDILVKLFAASFCARTGRSPQEALQVLLAGLETAKRRGYATLLAPTLQNADKELLAEEFAQLCEGMKRSFVRVLEEPKN